MSNLKNLSSREVKPEDKFAKRVSDKRFARVEGTFTKNLQKVNSLIDNMSEIEQIIHTRQVVTPAKDEKSQPTIRNLTPPEVQGFRKQLTELRLEKKIAGRKLSITGKMFQRTCKTNAASARSRISNINAKAKLAREAGRKVDDLSASVLDMIKRIKGKDQRYNLLSHSAKNDGRQFHLVLNSLVKAQLNEDYKLLSASPTVRTTVYNKVREYYGWKKKS